MKIGHIPRYLTLQSSWKEALKTIIQDFIHENVQIIVLSNRSMMGAFSFLYKDLSWFQEEQTAMIQFLQSLLPEGFVIVGAVISSLKNLKYCPVFLTAQTQHFTSFYEFQGFQLGALTDFEKNLPPQPCDYLFLLEEIPFAFYQQRIVSLEDQEKKALIYGQQFQCSVLSVNLQLAQENQVWDGYVVFYDHLHQQLYGGFIDKHSAVVEVNHKENHWYGHLSNSKYSFWEKVEFSIVKAIHSYYQMGQFQKIIVGLSGGIDSSLVATLAAKAVGAKHVLGVLMPGPFSSDHSIQDARELCQRLQIAFDTISIEKLYEEFLHQLEQGRIDQRHFTLMNENLQARIRGTLLMAYSNQMQGLVLNTCNKSEDAVGYSTLYGDAVGGFAPIGDLYKTEVYALAQAINQKTAQESIPKAILQKFPSAELREGQKDSDSLPEYDILDLILRSYLDEYLTIDQIIHQYSLKKQIVMEVIKKIHSSEYKRRQSPLVLRLSSSKGLLQKTLPILGNIDSY